MLEDKPVKHQIRDRLRGMAVGYGVIIVALLVGAILLQSPAMLIGVGIAVLGVVSYVLINERSARKNN